jgi:hypothetical protein
MEDEIMNFGGKFNAVKVIVLVGLGFVFICGSIGYLTDHVIAGSFIGLGIACLASAIYIEN